MNSEIIGPVTLAVSQSVMAFVTFLPKLTDIRRANANADKEMVADVHVAEVAAFTLAIGVGIIVSSLVQSPVPLGASLVMCFILWSMYESVLAAKGEGVRCA